MSFSRKIRTKYDEGFGPDKFNLGSFALPRVEAKKSGSSLRAYMLNQCFLYMGWLAIVRSPDPLADGSDFFKVRRGPCLG